LLALGSADRSAWAVDAQSCATAYAKGQDDRLAGRLYDARRAFLECAAPVCSPRIATDCALWAHEVEADLPTARVQVADAAGRPVADLRVFVDGVELRPEEWSKPIVLEAGPHLLRFEAPGLEPVDAQTALRPTDRELPVRATMRAPGPPPMPDRAPARHEAPVASVVLAGVGVIALGTAAYFGLSARSRYHQLETSCAPRCPRDAADEVDDRALVADIALATSLAALGAAAWIYWGTEKRPRAALAVGPRAGGGSAALHFAF
jgi:hypothetical protein